MMSRAERLKLAIGMCSALFLIVGLVLLGVAILFGKVPWPTGLLVVPATYAVLWLVDWSTEP